MATVICTRLISSANSAPMTTTFMSAIRATGTTRNAAGYIVDAAGTARACFVNASGSWDLSTTLAIGVPVDAQTFADLRGTWPSGVTLVNAALANGTSLGILVTAGPSDPPPPPPP